MRDALARDRDLCRNFLCILESLDQAELVRADILAADDHNGWFFFRDHPFSAYRLLDDAREERCFALVQGRLTERLRAAGNVNALLLQADLALHDRTDEHGEWAHDLVHLAAAHLSDDPDIRVQAALETPKILAAIAAGKAP